MKKKLFKITLKLILTIAIFAMFFKLIDINDLKELFSKISVSSILLYLFLYLGVYLMRAFRFFLLTDKKANLAKWLIITCIHSLYNRILPARSGEVSLLYYAKRIGNVEIINSLNILLISRLGDLISVIILFLMALITSYSALNVYPKVIVITLIFILFALFILIMQMKKVIEFSFSLLKRILYKFKIFSEFQRRLGQINYDKITKLSNKSLLQVIIISTIQWIILYFLFFIILKNIKSGLSFSYTILGSAYSNISNLIPISAVGGFGTMEAGWVLGFIILGVSKSVALSTGFTVNIITFVLTIILGLVGMFCSKIYKKKV